MAADPTEHLAHSPQIFAAAADGQIVLMQIEDGEYFSLDAIGSEIWRRLEVSKRVDVLIAELQDYFDGDAATIEREVIDFLSLLKDSGLIVTV